MPFFGQPQTRQERRNSWHFLILQSKFYRPLLSHWEPDLVSGALSMGAGLGIWGVINLLEGYGNDNPGAKSQGMKQLMAGGGVALIGMLLVPQLAGLFG